MRKIITIFISVLSLTCFSQNDDYFPLVREGVRWVFFENYIDWLYGHNDSHYYYIEFRGDTIVEGRHYKKCYQYADDKETSWSLRYFSKDEPYVLARELGHQVRIFYYKEINDPYCPGRPVGTDLETMECILYDFDMPQKDFIFDGYITIGGRNLRKFVDRYSSKRMIIESIGFVDAKLGDIICLYFYISDRQIRESGLSYVEDDLGRILYKGPNYHYQSADVNRDNRIDVEDVNYVINNILSSNILDVASDANGDGKTDVEDVNQIINVILKCI